MHKKRIAAKCFYIPCLHQIVLSTHSSALLPAAAGSKLGITLNPLTSANYSAEITRLQSELLANADDYVRRQADNQLASMIESATREQVETAVIAAAKRQVTDKVTEAARAEVRRQVMAGGEQQVRAAVEATAREQVTPQVQAGAKEKVRAEVEAQARQTVESAIRNPSEDAGRTADAK